MKVGKNHNTMPIFTYNPKIIFLHLHSLVFHPEKCRTLFYMCWQQGIKYNMKIQMIKKNKTALYHNLLDLNQWILEFSPLFIRIYKKDMY